VSGPGFYVTHMTVEGRMESHREWVQMIAAEIGSGVEPDNAAYINRFTVPSSSGRASYLVSQRRTSGEWCCSCRGWITHRRCKHLTAILSRLAAHTALEDAARAKGAAVPDGVVRMLASARSAFDVLGGIK
jgi:hypothetical protein